MKSAGLIFGPKKGHDFRQEKSQLIVLLTLFLAVFANGSFQTAGQEQALTPKPDDSPVFSGIWAHGLLSAELEATGSTVDQELREIGAHGIALLVDARHFLDPGFPARLQAMERNGVKAIVRIYSGDLAAIALRAGAQPNDPKDKTPEPLFADPVFIDEAVRFTERTVQAIAANPRKRDLVFGFWLIDEPGGVISRAVLPSSHGYLLQGISPGVEKLTYYRWWDERLLELQRRIYETVKLHLPETVVFSPNYYFSNGVEAHDYLKIAPYADIFICVAYARMNDSYGYDRGTYNAGFATKMLSDLTGKTVWTHPQVMQYRRGVPDAQTIRHYMNQVIEAGGQGLFFYASDLGSQAPRYVRHKDPERWNAIVEYADLVRDRQYMKQRQAGVSGGKRQDGGSGPAKADAATKAETAVLVSIDDLMAGTHKGHSLYTAYVILRERLQIDFDFVTVRKLLAEAGDLESYRTIYVPETGLLTEDAVTKLKELAGAGRHVIITDPAFRLDRSHGYQQKPDELIGSHLYRPNNMGYGQAYEIINYDGGKITLFRKNPFTLQRYRNCYWIETIRQIQQML